MKKVLVNRALSLAAGSAAMMGLSAPAAAQDHPNNEYRVVHPQPVHPVGPGMHGGHTGPAARAHELGLHWLRHDRPEAALPHLLAAAEQGNVASMRALATLYAEGNGVPRDDAEALQWFYEAARNGDAASMHVMGLVFLRGIAVERDPELAAFWLNRAANIGHRPSRRLLAQLD